MLKHLICLIVGYLVGTLSPAALLSRLKNKNLKESNTGNLGATNTMLTFGWSYGIFVMVFDVFKAFAVYRIMALLFPELELAGLLAGIGSVIGHIFPFYLKFKGGKGVACFGGVILAMDPILFPLLVVIGLILSLLVDYMLALPISAAVLFPFLAWMRSGSLAVFSLCLAMDILIIYKHANNFTRIKNGEEIHLRAFFRKNKTAE